MDRKMLRDDQWELIERLLPCKASDRGVTAKDNRRFVEAVLWVMRTSSSWHNLPAEFGHWHRTYVRFSRWREEGVFERVVQAMRSDADMEHLFIDLTIVRAHQHYTSFQSTYPAQLGSPSLPRPQPDRTLLRSPQVLPAYRHTLRQTGIVLPVARSSGMCLHLVGLT